MTRVAIVVLNWNGLEDTRRCLESLFTQDYNDFKVLLVDNGSVERGTDTFLSEQQEKYGDKLQILRNTVNKGFAGGVNTGIERALEDGFDYVALFNNDAAADKKWLSELMTAAEREKSGITTGLLLHADGKTIDSTGDWCTTWGLPFPRDRDQPADTASSSGEVFSGSGGASLYSIAMLREIGLFDETLFAYYEDTDISFRAQLYGWKIYYTNQAIAYHSQGATSSKIPGFTTKQTFKNLPLFYIKNMPTKLLLRTGPRFILAYWLMFGNAVKNGRGKAAFIGWLQQVWYFWTNALPARFVIQSHKKVSAEDIWKKLWPDLPPDQTGLRKFRKIFTGKS